MGQVNGRRESRALERDFEPPTPVQGAQPSAKNGRIPGLFRADQQTERLSVQAVLAEGSSLAPNTLFAEVGPRNHVGAHHIARATLPSYRRSAGEPGGKV
jgi:hypothetical protein